jgi:hypothetical protein
VEPLFAQIDKASGNESKLHLGQTTSLSFKSNGNQWTRRMTIQFGDGILRLPEKGSARAGVCEVV